MASSRRLILWGAEALDRSLLTDPDVDESRSVTDTNR